MKEEVNGMTAASRLRDHDLLVKVDTKVDYLTDKLNDLNDGLNTRVTKLEARADANDVYHASIDLPYYKYIAEWAYGFKAKLAVFIFIGGSLMIIINAVVISIIQNYIFHIK